MLVTRVSKKFSPACSYASRLPAELLLFDVTGQDLLLCCHKLQQAVSTKQM